MTGTRQAETESYAGHLLLGANRFPVNVRIGMNAAGTLEFEFETIELNKESKFIYVEWYSESRETRYFGLDAATAQGTTFSTTRLFFTSLNNRSDASGTWFSPAAQCDLGLLRYRLVNPAERPALRMRLKGFKNFGILHEDCTLGTVVARGQHEIDDIDTITGSFGVQATDDVDALVWREDAEKLLKHIQRVMSLAATTLLRAPIVEFFCDDMLEVTVRSETRQYSGFAPIVHFLAQEAIFKAGVS